MLVISNHQTTGNEVKSNSNLMSTMRCGFTPNGSISRPADPNTHCFLISSYFLLQSLPQPPLLPQSLAGQQPHKSKGTWQRFWMVLSFASPFRMVNQTNMTNHQKKTGLVSPWCIHTWLPQLFVQWLCCFESLLSSRTVVSLPIYWRLL